MNLQVSENDFPSLFANIADSPLEFLLLLLNISRGRINASTDLPLKHTRNKLYKELVLQHLVLQLFDDSRKGSTRFVSTGMETLF